MSLFICVLMSLFHGAMCPFVNVAFLGNTWPHSTFDNLSNYRSRGRKFDPVPVPYFC